MPYQIIKADIVNLPFFVDAIICPARLEYTKTGTGVDGVIHKKAGPELLGRRKLQGRIGIGKAKETPSFGLSSKTKFLIHTVSPAWDEGKHNEEMVLKECYTNALEIAIRLKCKTVAVPLLGAGNLGFPPKIAHRVAIAAFTEYCEQYDITIYLVVLDEKVYDYCNRLQRVPSKVGKREAERIQKSAYTKDGRYIPPEETYILIRDSRAKYTEREDKIQKILEETADVGFSGTLIKLIEGLNYKPSDVYSQVDITRDYFSKIKRNRKKSVKKELVIRFAAVLQLNLQQTEVLLKRAGYAFQNNQYDNIARSVIARSNYSHDDLYNALKNAKLIEDE